MKRSEFKRYEDLDKFSMKYACRMHNHCGKGKYKRSQRKLARHKLLQQFDKEIFDHNNEYHLCDAP